MDILKPCLPVIMKDSGIMYKRPFSRWYDHPPNMGIYNSTVEHGTCGMKEQGTSLANP